MKPSFSSHCCSRRRLSSPGNLRSRRFRSRRRTVRRRPRAWLGLQVSKPDETITAHVPSLPPGIGFVVKSVDERRPRRSRRTPEFDFLWKIGDQMLVNEGQLAALLRLSKPGDEITLSGFRGGKPLEVKLKLGEAPVMQQPFPGDMVDAAILPGDCRGPMRVVNVAEKTRHLLNDEGRAVVRRDGEAYKVKIHGPKDELIYEGGICRQMANLDKVPEEWRRRVHALRRGLDHALEGRHDAAAPAAAAGGAAAAPKPVNCGTSDRFYHGNALRFATRLPIFRRMHPDVAKLVEAGRIPKPVGERLSQLAPGNFCIHKSFGAGKVIDWDLPGKKVTIDFEKSTGQAMELQFAFQKTEWIPADDFRAKKIEQLEELRALSKSDPIALVVHLLQSHGGSMTGDALEKNSAAPSSPKPGFKKWWDATKKALRESRLAVVPQKRTEADRAPHRRPQPGRSARRRFRSRPRHQGHDPRARSHRRGHRRF